MESELSYYADEGITKFELERFRENQFLSSNEFNGSSKNFSIEGAVNDLAGRDKEVVRLTKLAINISNKYRRGLTDEQGERDWVKQADCLDEDTEIFYPKNGRDFIAKLAICETCPVRNDCLAYALKHKDVNGIWGGSSGNERRAILKDIKSKKIKKSEIDDYVAELAKFE